MDLTDLRVASASPDPVRMAVTSSRATSDFVDVDLNAPKFSKAAMVPPPMSLSSQNTPHRSQGSTAPALPLTSSHAGPGIVQVHPPNARATNPTLINGNSSVVPPSNALVAMNASLGTQVPIRLGTTVISQGRPLVDMQIEVAQNGSGAPGNPAVTDAGKCLPLPAGQTSCPTSTDRRATFITDAVAKQAFREYRKSKCCCGAAPAKEMTTEELLPLNTYRYCLETFTESRNCEWVTEQYTGQHVDSANIGSALQPWEVPVVVPDMFKDGTQKMKVPNTSSVKACSQCKGMGKNMCLKCHGTGRIQCTWCNGTGRRMQMEMCPQCFGSGTESCRMCSSTNAQNCVSCAGRGQVLTYMQLNVTWKNNQYQFISDHHSEFSSDLFKTVHGEKIFTDEQLSVSPLADFPDSSITWASQNALEQHRTQFSSSCRVLRQRQSVELLPLTKVQYSWKGNQRNYFVYGKENLVYVQNYPQKSCCAVM
ncbi:protein SSUH2 homolog [Rhinoderma darwinii]|uniref:protein SSUH2 homolog n=1 Tax=Rhinoderma darwinii TaxID=43563 RepID=UPI003F67416E